MVYFIHNPQANAVKIGRSDDPGKRLRALQTANPAPLEILLSMPGGADVEKQFHRDFAEFRISGEWFTYDFAIECFIEELRGNMLLFEIVTDNVFAEPGEVIDDDWIPTF